MNPVLLKPNSDTGAQVIIQGQAIGNLEALKYHHYKPQAAAAVLDSHQRLVAQYPYILVEGAGSPAEINLRAGDIANMGFAEAVDCPVILIADIDKGGVFAHLVGTLALLSASEQARVKGFVINCFRGDIALLQDGLDWLEQYTGKPVLGVLPYLHGLNLDAEDAVPKTQSASAVVAGEHRLRVIVPLLPRISNHTDFEPLRLHPQIDLHYVRHDESIPVADLIILPGSKNVGFDLAWLKQQVWEIALQKHLRYGGKVLGICSGLQMLGQRLYDPDGVEGAPNEYAGLGLLELETILRPHKQLHRRSGDFVGTTVPVCGYEIHCGESSGAALERPAITLETHDDGACSADGQIIATYLHGVLDEPEALQYLLHWAGLPQVQYFDVNAQREQQLERLADSCEAALDMEKMLALLGADTALHPAS